MWGLEQQDSFRLGFVGHMQQWLMQNKNCHYQGDGHCGPEQGRDRPKETRSKDREAFRVGGDSAVSE